MNHVIERLSAGLIVLLLSLTPFIIIDEHSQVLASGPNGIYIPVQSAGSPVTGAYVNLTNVHTGSVITAQYSSSMGVYTVPNAPSGYYRVDVVANDYFDQIDAAEFRFDGFSNYTSSTIDLHAFPYRGSTWNVTVTDSYGFPVMGASVGFYYQATGAKYGEYVAKATTDVYGNAVFNMFNTTSAYELVVMKATYATYLEPVTVTADGWRNITLSPSHRVTGFVADSNGPANNVVAYLVNQDSSVPWVVRVLKSYGSFVAFDAYDGTFTLVADADGDSSFVSTVTVSGGNVMLSIPTLAPQTQGAEMVNITFGADYNSFSLSVDAYWSYDRAYPGLPFNDMGSLRAQVDLVMGDGNGYLDSTEISAFFDRVRSFGTQYVSSSGLIDVNDTVFASALSVTGFDIQFGDGAGPVTLSDTARYGYTCQYASSSPVDVDADEYIVDATVPYDSTSVDHRLQIALVHEYELVANTSTNNVVVSGYQVVGIDPTLVSTGGQETVVLTVQKSAVPIAAAGIVASQHAYAVRDSYGNLARYIVAVNRNVTLTSSGSADPNGNPLTYTWDFGDGSPVVTTADLEVVHRFTQAALVIVNLTVTDVVGLQNWSDIDVTCDAIAPTPIVTVKDKTVVGSTIEADQRETLVMNATSSTDDAVAMGDGLGIIDYVRFDFGDGNASGVISWSADQQNVSHAYETAGNYTLTLNVTDVVGHWRNTTVFVHVNDSTPPTPVAVIWPSPALAGQVVWFDGLNSSDADGSIVSYSWTFTDDGVPVTLEGANVSYVFGTGPQMVTVMLNCTDSSGNWATTVVMLQVSGAIPEFPDPIVPIAGMAVLVCIIAIRTRKGRT